MKWNIITDSSCDLIHGDNKLNGINFEKVPFTISIGTKDYVDDGTINLDEMIDNMEGFAKASHTSCPPPEAWYKMFEKSDNTIAITISKNLSGSYNSAFAARNMILEKYPEKNIYIVDSLSAGSALAMIAEKATELIDKLDDFEKVVEKLQEYALSLRTIFALSSFGNLVKNGRMNKLAGFLAGKLGFWGIGVASDEGKIAMKGKTRGVDKLIISFIDDMKENLFNEGTVVISHCKNPELAAHLKECIKSVWHSAEVKILATGGLCSYYAERGGLIIAY